jgi:hypothetical protein
VDTRAVYGDETQTKWSFTAAIVDLANRIEARWQRVQYDDDAFADIAQRALTEQRLHERYDTGDVLREAITGRLLVPQVDIQATFGQPPITYFRNSRFHVAMLFWLDSTTSIHEHSFSGAFSVFGGSSLHVRYGFTPRKRVNSRLAVGDIVRKGADILKHGAVQKIVAGSQGAHALFHLERPSATLIVRTFTDGRAHPQFSYHWPCYAIDPFFEDHAIGRKCQLLRLLHQSDEDSFRNLATELLASLEFESAVRVLLFFRQLNLSLPLALELASTAADRHRELGEGLVQLVEAGYREDALMRLRRRVLDPERRLLLAFLLNKLSAIEVNALVASKYAGSDPVDLVSAWIASLLTDLGGMDGSPVVIRAIHLLLDSDNLSAASQRLSAELDIAAGAERDGVLALMRILSDSPLLSSLFAFPAHASRRGEGADAT